MTAETEHDIIPLRPGHRVKALQYQTSEELVPTALSHDPPKKSQAKDV